MTRSRALFKLVVAALAIIYTAGATDAAFACAMSSITSGVPTDLECGDNSAHRDCALTCAPMCAAVASVATELVFPEPTSPNRCPGLNVCVSGARIGPEPPPPR